MRPRRQLSRHVHAKEATAHGAPTARAYGARRPTERADGVLTARRGPRRAHGARLRREEVHGAPTARAYGVKRPTAR